MRRSRFLADVSHSVIVGCLLVALINGPAKGTELEGRPLQLEVFLNGESTKMIGAFTLSADGRLTAKRKELTGLGINPPSSGGDDDDVPLNDMPGLAFQYDEPRQRLDVTLANERRTTNLVDGRGEGFGFTAPETQTGAALNYLLFSTAVVDDSNSGSLLAFSGASAQLQGRLFSPYGTIAQTGIIGRTANQSNEAIRLDTTYRFSHAESATTGRIGDFVSSGPAWARPIRLGGVQVERNYGLRPDIITAALPTLSGSAAAPSTIDVYVNNVRTFSRDLPVGPYSVANIPGLLGTGQAQVVLRDASGREVRQDLNFYTSPKLLGEGVLDFSLQAGFARYNYAFSSSSYGETPLYTGSFRYGVHSNITVEGYGEGGAGLWNMGGGIVVNAANYAIFSAAGRISQYGGETGTMGYLGVETKIGFISLSASTQRTFGVFQDLASVTARQALSLTSGSSPIDALNSVPTVTSALSTVDPRPFPAIDRVSIAMPGPFDKSSISGSYVHTLSLSGAESHIGTVSFTKVFGRSTTVSLNAFSDFGTNPTTGVYLGLSMPIGQTMQAAAGISQSKGGLTGSTEIMRPMGQEAGDWGWRARASGDADTRVYNAAAGYRTRYGRAEISGDVTGSVKRASAEFEGALVAVGTKITAGPRADDSFAIVDAGAPNVDVMHQNRRIGTTDSRGLLLVPNLVPNQKNVLTIDTSNLPIGAHIESTQAIVTPAPHGAISVDFGIRSDEQSAIVILHNAKGEPLRAGFKGMVENGDTKFVVGHGGRAFVRNLSSQTTLVVDLIDGECRATVSHTADATRQATIGPVTCQ